jgi:hypothetical protein
MNFSGKTPVLLLGAALLLLLAGMSPAIAGGRTDIAEVANELHRTPHSEIVRELQPDRVQLSPGYYDGRLESIPGLNLPQ